MKFGRGKTARADRRLNPRKLVNVPGVVSAPSVEMACIIVDLSDGGMKLRLDRGTTLPPEVAVIDVADGVAYSAVVVWQRRQEAGLRQTGAVSLRGLVPARMAGARDAWLRAGGV
ncbi:PilZ domain-containing protein [Brevundimonas nasdae]|uniref:PilZ domain-containing protein n=1 Tax=Brevundimonas nasdae TaxID=172043 RepID=UPI001913C483|nr:PilZ domain-containing protein [Brevundimonas nasdae]MBK6025307.1 PilZ domain-containing protein [Brevundimonas nasdae]